jgi:uncharacterized repeat protein (TIGR01451 family)
VGRLPRLAIAGALLAGSLLASSAGPAHAISGADIAVTMSADLSHAREGDLVVYTIVVTNPGDATASNVAVGFGAPDNLSFFSLTCGDLACSNLGGVGPGQTVVGVATGSPNPCGLSFDRFKTVTAVATVSADNDADPSNNSDEVTIRVNGRCHL